jgi:hypothetical protein
VDAIVVLAPRSPSGNANSGQKGPIKPDALAENGDFYARDGIAVKSHPRREGRDTGRCPQCILQCNRFFGRSLGKYIIAREIVAQIYLVSRYVIRRR